MTFGVFERLTGELAGAEGEQRVVVEAGHGSSLEHGVGEVNDGSAQRASHSLKMELHLPEQQLVSLTQLWPFALQTLAGWLQMPDDDGRQTVAEALRSAQQSSSAPQSASEEHVFRHAPVEAKTPSEVPLAVTFNAQYRFVPAHRGAVFGHGWLSCEVPPPVPPPALPPPALPPPVPPLKHALRVWYWATHAVVEPKFPATQVTDAGAATRQSNQVVAALAHALPRSC